MAPDDSAEIETVLKVGDLVKLRIDVGQSRRAYDGWVAGLGEGRVTVNVPEASPLLLIGPSDFRVVMRKETDYALYRIEALARPRVGTRAPQLDLMPQGEIQRVQRRWNVRLKVLIDLRETVLIEGEQEKPFKSTILDLSAGGVLIHTREPLLVGATVGLDFALPGSPDPLETRAKVVWVDKIGSEGWEYFRAGATFVRLGKQQENAIIRFAFQEQLRRRRMERLR